ncbi:hypothetical protein EJ02DRAFT_459553 [Clathrospora elynae]|uniref:Uncharacterized protein n=1 Tax=Clathrospora elynae TaxID=706981 RepID=A0A6A5SD52_9PLEO|nr:hypothetical protein EJ02DRAFT_459553 [Clathrospora elynae]
MSLDSFAVPKLQKDGSNLLHWHQAFELYANSIGAASILAGSSKLPPSPQIDEPEPWDSSMARKVLSRADAMKQRVKYEEQRRKVLDITEAAVQAHKAKVNEWNCLDLLLRLAILKTTDQTLYSSLPKDSIAAQVNAIKHQYQEQGINEECSSWAEFMKLRCQDCTSTQQFTDQFQAGIARLESFDMKLPAKCYVYQFLLAIAESYPEFAKDCHHDIRKNRNLTI